MPIVVCVNQIFQGASVAKKKKMRIHIVNLWLALLPRLLRVETYLRPVFHVNDRLWLLWF